jgi:hypothetical protein
MFYKKLIFLIFCVLTSCGTTNRYNLINPSANDNYTVLLDQVTSEYRMIGVNTLKFSYRELYESNQLIYKIYNDKHNVVQTESDEPVAIRYGTNYIDLPLSNLSSGRFVLEVINAKNRKKYLHFYLK